MLSNNIVLIPAVHYLNLKEITDQTEPADEQEPFFVFVPTYLDGGNGITSGFTEIMTTALGEYIAYGDNAQSALELSVAVIETSTNSIA